LNTATVHAWQFIFDLNFRAYRDYSPAYVEGGVIMKRLGILAVSAALALSIPHAADARSHSYSSRPYYGGGHHTSSHGGHFTGSHSGSSHKGGHYVNARTGNHYGRHK
jgi:hypothetical protein